MSLSFCSEFLLCYFFTFEIIVLFPQEVFCEENWNFGKMIALENATILPRAVPFARSTGRKLVHTYVRGQKNSVRKRSFDTRRWMLFALKVKALAYLVDNFVCLVAGIASFVADLWRLRPPIGRDSSSLVPLQQYTRTWQAWPPSQRRSSRANSLIRLHRTKNLTKSRYHVVCGRWNVEKWQLVASWIYICMQFWLVK